MSTLLGWIERVRAAPGVTRALAGAKTPSGNLYLYDDCCVWGQGELKPFRQLSASRAMHKQAQEQSNLTTDELLSRNNHNWRVKCSEIVNAELLESKTRVVLVLNLADGTNKRLLMDRSRDDHHQKDLCQRWLGEKLTVE